MRDPSERRSERFRVQAGGGPGPSPPLVGAGRRAGTPWSVYFRQGVGRVGALARGSRRAAIRISFFPDMLVPVPLCDEGPEEIVSGGGYNACLNAGRNRGGVAPGGAPAARWKGPSQRGEPGADDPAGGALHGEGDPGGTLPYQDGLPTHATLPAPVLAMGVDLDPSAASRRPCGTARDLREGAGGGGRRPRGRPRPPSRRGPGRR